MTVRGRFGPETAVVQLRGLHRDKRYALVKYQPAPSATVRVTETGPVVPELGVASHTDFLGPVASLQGLEGDGDGTISVAPNGRGGSLEVSLPQGDLLSGHWLCGSRRTGGPISRPILAPAKVPPVVGECSLGSYSATSPAPITCPDGDINIEAWTAYSYVDGAGRRANLDRVEDDLCRDEVDNRLTTTQLIYVYSLAALYYGWKFPLTPTQVVAATKCGS
ncbi:MAG: hypothetical protein WBA31_08425 [Candidatus Dormiibacterota bacterium]